MNPRSMVLATPSAGLQDIQDLARQREEAFVPLNARWPDLEEWLLRIELWFGPRGNLETNPAFRQLIPYIVLVNEDRSHVMTYRRSGLSSETRLRGRLSIGIGGHIETQDALDRDEAQGIDLVRNAAEREVFEEVHVIDPGPRGRRWIGWLITDETPVDLVHLGIVGAWTISDAAWIKMQDGDVVDRANDPGLESITPMSLAELEQAKDQLESWSAALLPHLPVLLSG